MKSGRKNLKESVGYVEEKIKKLGTSKFSTIFECIKNDQIVNVREFEKKIRDVGEAELNPDLVKAGTAYFEPDVLKSWDRHNKHSTSLRIAAVKKINKPSSAAINETIVVENDQGDDINSVTPPSTVVVKKEEADTITYEDSDQKTTKKHQEQTEQQTSVYIPSTPSSKQTQKVTKTVPEYPVRTYLRNKDNDVVLREKSNFSTASRYIDDLLGRCRSFNKDYSDMILSVYYSLGEDDKKTLSMNIDKLLNGIITIIEKLGKISDTDNTTMMLVNALSKLEGLK